MIRELNDIEYMNYSFGQPYNIVSVLRIKGKFSAELLEEVFEKIQQRHPLLKAGIELDKKGMPWVITENVGSIPVTIIKRSNYLETQNEFHNELITPFDMNKKELPLFRAKVLHTAKDFDLILCGQHTLGDGLSMVFLVRDILHLLNNPDFEVEILNAPIRSDDIFKPKIRRTISKTPIGTYLQMFFLKIVHGFLFGFRKEKRDYEEWMKSKHEDIQIYSWNFTEKQTEDFLKKCKREKISVHSAICTSFVPYFPTINNPVNLRARLIFPVMDSYGLYASGAVFKMRYRKKRDFWSNAHLYQRKLIWNLRDRKVFGIYRIINKSVPLPFLSKSRDIFIDIVSRQNPFAVTNLGSLDRMGLILDDEKFSLESFYGAVSSTFDAVTILVFTLRKKMYFHMHYMESVHDFNLLKEISEKVRKRLLES